MPTVPRFKSLCLHHVGACEILTILNGITEPYRFNQIHGGVEKLMGVKSQGIVANRLKELESVGLIRRIVKADPGSSVLISYEITQDGRDVLQMFEELEQRVTTAKEKIDAKRAK